MRSPKYEQSGNYLNGGLRNATPILAPVNRARIVKNSIRTTNFVDASPWGSLRCRVVVHVHDVAERSARSGSACESLPAKYQEARHLATRPHEHKWAGEGSSVVNIGFRGLAQGPGKASPRVQCDVRGVVTVDRGRFHFLRTGVSGVNTFARNHLAVCREKNALGPVGWCRGPIQSPRSNLAADGARVIHIGVANPLIVWRNAAIWVAVYIVDKASENEHRSEG